MWGCAQEVEAGESELQGHLGLLTLVTTLRVAWPVRICLKQSKVGGGSWTNILTVPRVHAGVLRHAKLYKAQVVTDFLGAYVSSLRTTRWLVYLHISLSVFYFCFPYMGVLPACMYVCVPSACLVSAGPEENVRFPRTGVTDGCEFSSLEPM